MDAGAALWLMQPGKDFAFFKKLAAQWQIR